MSPHVSTLVLLCSAAAGCTVHLMGCGYPVRRAGWVPEPQPPASVLADFAKNVTANDAWFHRADGSLLACSRYDARTDDCGVGALKFPRRNGRYDTMEASICSR